VNCKNNSNLYHTANFHGVNENSVLGDKGYLYLKEIVPKNPKRVLMVLISINKRIDNLVQPISLVNKKSPLNPITFSLFFLDHQIPTLPCVPRIKKTNFYKPGKPPYLKITNFSNTSQRNTEIDGLELYRRKHRIPSMKKYTNHHSKSKNMHTVTPILYLNFANFQKALYFPTHQNPTSNSETKKKKKNQNCRERTNSPSTGCLPGNLRLKLRRQTQKPIKPIKGHMRNMPHLGR